MMRLCVGVAYQCWENLGMGKAAFMCALLSFSSLAVLISETGLTVVRDRLKIFTSTSNELNEIMHGNIQ